MEPILKIENLTHTYSAGTPFERRAVDGVNLEVAPGEFLGVIGHTGSGKSTFIQHLNGLLRPTEGRILLEGRDIWAEPKKIRRVRFEVGLVFQYPEYQLFEETVYKDIAFGPGNMGLSKDEIDRRVREAAELVGLSEDMLAQSPFELSGGQKRRVAIAGVLAMNPSILVLDEPAAGLDPAGRREMLELIRGIHESGVTVVMVSHSMDDVGKYCNRLYVLDHGRIALEGAPAEVFIHGDELRAIGLDVPECAHLAALLREKGFEIDARAFSIEDVSAAILKNLNKGGMGK